MYGEWKSVKKDGNPKVPDMYMTTRLFGTERQILPAFWDDRFGWCEPAFSEDDDWMDLIPDYEIIAWTEYPEKYEGD